MLRSDDFLCEWMNNLPENVKNKKINKIILPGSWNSGTDRRLVTNLEFPLNTEKFDLFNCFKNSPKMTTTLKHIYNDLTILQKLSIREQLNSGIRFIHIKVSYSENDDIYYLTNITACRNIMNSLLDLSTFLDKYKSEIIILLIEPDKENIYSMSEEKTLSFLNKIYELFNEKILKKRNDFPTYNELIEVDKRIIIFYLDDRFEISNEFFWNKNNLSMIDYKSIKFTSLYENKLNIVLYKEEITDDFFNNAKTYITKMSFSNINNNINLNVSNYIETHKYMLMRMSSCCSYYVTKEYINNLINLNF